MGGPVQHQIGETESETAVVEGLDFKRHVRHEVLGLLMYSVGVKVGERVLAKGQQEGRSLPVLNGFMGMKSTMRTLHPFRDACCLPGPACAAARW